MTATVPPRTSSSLLWAVLIPAACLMGAVVGLCLWYAGGLFIGMLATATAATVAGIAWNRAGAAAVAGTAALCLMIFSGPVLHETYAAAFGERTEVLVVEVREIPRTESADFSCRVADASGAARSLDRTQNCRGQFEAGQRAVLLEDPLGALDPWISATDDHGVDVVGPGAVCGLLAVTATALFYAGMRRRPSRRHGPS
ncbi:hypothetical protein [Actinocorallia populi]|uniref:hypothetical protein n=1 Tax=Actinocorallia populi TaxID=2079200 RepID=UPI000D08A478|nr:hypothetical protein [Actinocorallia populi]